ncbi:hypothetical protein OAT96_02865 [Chitinophagales bacterium]|nr:hypothetical protein [Chitinophagales bacterium]
MKKVVFIWLISLFSMQVQAQSVATIVDQMISTLSAGKTYQYTMSQFERTDGEIHANKIFTKIQESPKKSVYR